MKVLVSLVVGLLLLAAWHRSMRREESRIHDAAYQYVRDICGENTQCHMRIDADFEHCFAVAYSGGVLPSQARVDLRAFARCFNLTDLNTRLEVTKDGKRPPFPTH